MTEVTGSIATALAILGVLLNNRRMIACFPIFMLSNSLCGILHVQAGIYSLVVRDCAFFILAIEGAWRWRKGKR